MPGKYSSTVQYPNTPIARKLKGIAQVHIGEIGTRIFYCDHSTFDTHAGQNPAHGNLWSAVSQGIDAFFADLREHNKSDNVIMLLFSEFGRRVRDKAGDSPFPMPCAKFWSIPRKALSPAWRCSATSTSCCRTTTMRS